MFILLVVIRLDAKRGELLFDLLQALGDAQQMSLLLSAEGVVFFALPLPLLVPSVALLEVLCVLKDKGCAYHCLVYILLELCHGVEHIELHLSFLRVHLLVLD